MGFWITLPAALSGGLQSVGLLLPLCVFDKAERKINCLERKVDFCIIILTELSPTFSA